MPELRLNWLHGAIAAALSPILFALPVAALAAVDIDPGTTASDLAADGGNTIEECADTADETCTVVINAAGNEVGALVDVTQDGAGTASGEVFTDFSITGNGDGALVGSFLSAIVDVSGVLSGLGPETLASVKASLEVTDTTASVLVAAETIVDDSIADGTIPISGTHAVVAPLPLTRGHSYRISLVLTARAAGSASAAAGALSDFVNTASWSDLSVTAGRDPFASIAELDARVTQLETDVDVLEERVDDIAEDLEQLTETVAELREDFDNHSHTYLTGRGVGHNNTEATTTTPVGVGESDPDSNGEDDSSDTDGDGVVGGSDLCPGTPGGAAVDASGCELAAFCAIHERSGACISADWQNDEPNKPRDCRWRHAACEVY